MLLMPLPPYLHTDRQTGVWRGACVYVRVHVRTGPVPELAYTGPVHELAYTGPVYELVYTGPVHELAYTGPVHE